MNAGWDAALAELRGEYLVEAPERLARGRAALARLRAGEHAAADDLRRVFHGFAGSGRTYGFDRVTELGLAGEELADTWPIEGVATTACASAEDLLVRLERELVNGEPPPPAAAPLHAPGASTPHAGGLDVLVIEDEAATLEALTTALLREGHGVRQARTLEAARALIETCRPGAVVADIVLPDGEVYGLVERLRAEPGGEELPVLLQSVRSSLVDRVEAIRCGADAFFPKPVEVDAVVRRLQLLRSAETEAARILSVEDDASQAAVLRSVLEAAGYAFHACPGPEGLEAALQGFRPDLLLMDAVLPGATGYDLVQALKQDERHALLPIVFLTAQGRPRDRLASSRAGATDHLVKPVTPAALLTTVAARLEQARLLRSLLERDGLTGLLTHSALFERVAAVASEARRRHEPAAWIMIDVDHFKQVNDGYGHATGDRVLRALGALLRRRLRQSDILGRYGGEEFAVVLRGIGVDDGRRLAERLREEFAALRHEAPDGSPIRVTFSAGVAGFRPSEDAKDWSRRADVCLYAAKGAGRNRVVAEARGGGLTAREGARPRRAGESGPGGPRTTFCARGGSVGT